MHKQMRQWLGAEVEDFIWHLRWRGHEIIRQRVESTASPATSAMATCTRR